MARFASCARCVPEFLSYAKRIGFSSGIADSLLTSLAVEKYKCRVALHFLRLLGPAEKAWRLAGPSPVQIRRKERAPVEDAVCLSKQLPDTVISLIKCKNLWLEFGLYKQYCDTWESNRIFPELKWRQGFGCTSHCLPDFLNSWSLLRNVFHETEY